MPSTPTLRVAVRKFEPFERSLREQFEDFCRVTGTGAELQLEVMDLNPLEAAYFEEGRLRDGSIDLAMVVTDWVAASVEQEALRDLRSLHAGAPLEDYPSAWSGSLTRPHEVAGGWWGVPYHDGPECLILRKDLLEAAGLDVPRTWSSFHDAARRLTDPSADVHGTVVAAFADGHNTFYDFCLQLWSRGGELLDGREQPALNQPAAADGLAFYRELVNDEQACVPGARQIDSVKAGELFMDGKVAMMANWFGFAAACETVEGSKVRGRVALAPLPGGDGPGAAAGVSLNVYWLMAIAAGSEQPRLAWDFLRHCAGREMDRKLTLNGAVGCRRSTWTDEQVNREIPFFRDLPALHEHARTLPIDTRLPALARVIESAVVRTLDSRDKIADILDDAQARAESAWNGSGGLG